jgi:alkaline phosphatase
LEIAQEMGKATGIVTTTYLQHATPAGFMTHVSSRYLTEEISRQIIEESNVDVLLGGGEIHFTAEQLISMEAKNYTIVRNKTELQAIETGKFMGLFADEHLPYEQDRNFTITPSLAEMTEKALNVLTQNDNGFFLMVEGGRIDHAGHDNNKVNAALETIAFAKAVDKAITYVKTHNNTILIVTADHETGGLAIQSESLDSSLPLFGYTAEQNRTIQITRANQINVNWATTSHTSTPVPFYGFGEIFTELNYTNLIENTEIFNIMDDYYSGRFDEIKVTTSETNIAFIYSIPVISITIILYFYRKKKVQFC